MNLAKKNTYSNKRTAPGKLNHNKLDLLLVEDGPLDAQLLRAAFEQGGHAVKVEHALSGEECFQMLKKRLETGASLPDLILLDLNLPRKHGKTVLAEIKNDDLLKRIPVIIWTGSIEEEDVTSCSELQANSYILKPGVWDEYIETAIFLTNFVKNRSPMPPVRSVNSLVEAKRATSDNADEFTDFRAACESVHKLLSISSDTPTPKWTEVILLTLAVSRILRGLEKNHVWLWSKDQPYDEVLHDSPHLIPKFKKLKDMAMLLEISGNELALELGRLSRDPKGGNEEVRKELLHLISQVKRLLSSEVELVHEHLNDTPALD